MAALTLLCQLTRAIDTRIRRKPGGWAGDGGQEIAQALALAAAAIFATIAIFAVFQSNAIELVQALFRLLTPGEGN